MTRRLLNFKKCFTLPTPIISSPFPHFQSRISHFQSPSSSLFSHFQSSSPPQISHFQSPSSSRFSHFQSSSPPQVSHYQSPSSPRFSHFQSSSPPQISHFQFLTPTFPAAVRHFSSQTYFDPDLTHKYSNVNDTIDASLYPSESQWYSREEVMTEHFRENHFVVDEENDLLVGFDKKRKWCVFWTPAGRYIRKSPFLDSFIDCEYVGLTDCSVVNGKEDIHFGKPGYCSVSFFATNGLICYLCHGYIGIFSNFYGEVKAVGCFLEFARNYLRCKLDIRTDCQEAWEWILQKKVPNDQDLINLAKEVHHSWDLYWKDFKRCHFRYFNRNKNPMADDLAKIARTPFFRRNHDIGQLEVRDYPWNSRVMRKFYEQMDYHYMKVGDPLPK